MNPTEARKCRLTCGGVRRLSRQYDDFDAIFDVLASFSRQFPPTFRRQRIREERNRTFLDRKINVVIA